MARRKRDLPIEDTDVAEQERLSRRFGWLARAARGMSDPASGVGDEIDRLNRSGRPLSEQLDALERLLAERGLLERADRVAEQVARARARRGQR